MNSTTVPPAPDEQAARDRAMTVIAHLVDFGLRASEVTVRVAGAAPAEGAPEAVVGRLAFNGYVARVPECGDWSDNLAFGPSNVPGPNFGCATQRNIGLMVSNPRDLIEKRGTAPGRDAARGVDVLGKYQTGQDTRSSTPVSGAVSAQTQGQGGGQ